MQTINTTTAPTVVTKLILLHIFLSFGHIITLKTYFVKEYFYNVVLKIILDMRGRFLYNMRMRNYKRKPWSMKEKGLLSQHYYKLPLAELQELLPERTENSIRKQVSYLKSKGWRFKK